MSIPQKELDGLFQRFAAPLVNGEAAKRFGEPVAKQLAQTFWRMMIDGPMSEAYLWNSFGESFTSDDVAMLRRCFEEEMKPSLSLPLLTGLGEWYLKSEERKFAVGDRVRVRHGTLDPDYSDLPLGGWRGTITELGEEGYCMIKLNQDTLDHIHPVYKRRSERDGLKIEELEMKQEDLEPDFGEDLPLEQPTNIQTKPLDPTDTEDRIRAALGVTTDDAVPFVEKETLLKFVEHLKANLTFPFLATYSHHDGKRQLFRRVSVVGMSEGFPIDDEYGLVCKVTVEKEEWEVPLVLMESSMSDPNLQLLEDYRWWFNEWSGHASIPHSHVNDDYQDDEDEEPEPPKRRVGRNDPCPCGSGKKFKKCCINKRESDLFVKAGKETSVTRAMSYEDTKEAKVE